MPQLSIIYVTNRPGGYDILFHSLLQQTNQDYEIIAIDDGAKERHPLVEEYAKQLSISNFQIRPSKPKSGPYRFGLCNAMNTGLIYARGPYVTVLQDYAWLPPTFVERTIAFFRERPYSLLGYPETFYIAPRNFVKDENLTNPLALTIFINELRYSPSSSNWRVQPHPIHGHAVNPPDITPGEYKPHWFWECFCASAPIDLYVELNGFDEALDQGDDCHESNIRDRAKLLGYDIWIDGGSIIEQIEHRQWLDSPLWHRYPENTNISRWRAMWQAILEKRYPLRAPNRQCLACERQKAGTGSRCLLHQKP